MLLATLLLLTTLALGFYTYYKHSRRRMEMLAAKIPGDAGVPLLGDIWRFVRKGSLKGMRDEMKKDELRYKGIQRYWIGKYLIIRISDPTYVEKILSNSAVVDKALIFYNVFKAAVDGPFTSNGSGALYIRKALWKTMGKQLCEKYHNIFVRRVNLLIEHLDKRTGKEFDIQYTIFSIVSDIGGETHMGLNMNELEERRFTNCLTYLMMALTIVIKRRLKPFSYYTDLLFNDSKEEKILQDAIVQGNRFTNFVIDERMKFIDQQNCYKYCGEETFSDTIIKYSLQNGETRQDTRKKLLEITVAGSSTTSTALSSVLLFLAMFPELQDKARAEQQDIFGDSTREPTSQDIGRMDYLSRFVKETLRIIVWTLVGRNLTSDIDLGEYILPKDSNVVISFQTVHMDPTVWDQPYIFNPDNFLPDRVAARPKGSYLPFLIGPRACPGSQYSINVTKTVVSGVLRNFKLSSSLKYEELKFEHKLLQYVSQGYMVKFERLNQS